MQLAYKRGAAPTERHQPSEEGAQRRAPLAYRREIDGLRALAVIPVILFHAGFQLFSGGFVGVDVFFVISGYLITGIILGDLAKKSFSIVAFYERRARRILPALFFMMAVFSAVAWFTLLPMELRNFSKGTISVVLFASNLLFWRQSGYFDPSAETNPLLHTWSLAVEEQFYIFFPILLLMIWKCCRRFLPAIIALSIVVSLALAQWASVHEPTANFFLLPTRAWELAIGSLCAIHLSRTKALPAAGKTGDALSLLGLALIIGTMFLFDRNTPFPSLLGLAPTVGTALIILFANPENHAGRLLSLKWMVGIGLISYSAYLWHQPLFVFFRQISATEPGVPIALLLIIQTFVMAWLSWAYVEQPFRSKNAFSRAQIFQLSLVGILLFVAVGAAGLLTNGGAFRFGERDRKFLAQADYRISMKDFSYQRCFIDFDQSASDLYKNECFPARDGRPRLVIFGDSEAAHLSYGARSVFQPQGYQIVQWTATSCRPFIFTDTTDRCKSFVNSFQKNVLPSLTARDRVLLAGNWGTTHADIGAGFGAELREGLKGFAASPASVVVIGNAPDFRIQPVQSIFRLVGRGEGEPIYSDRIEYPEAENVVRAAVEETGYSYFNPAAVVCAKDHPRQCQIFNGSDPVFIDSNHLSKAGSVAVMSALSRSGKLGENEGVNGI